MGNFRNKLTSSVRREVVSTPVQRISGSDSGYERAYDCRRFLLATARVFHAALLAIFLPAEVVQVAEIVAVAPVVSATFTPARRFAGKHWRTLPGILFLHPGQGGQTPLPPRVSGCSPALRRTWAPSTCLVMPKNWSTMILSRSFRLNTWRHKCLPWGPGRPQDPQALALRAEARDRTVCTHPAALAQDARAELQLGALLPVGTDEKVLLPAAAPGAELVFERRLNCPLPRANLGVAPVQASACRISLCRRLRWIMSSLFVYSASKRSMADNDVANLSHSVLSVNLSCLQLLHRSCGRGSDRSVGQAW